MHRIDAPESDWCNSDAARRSSPALCTASYIVYETSMNVPCVHSIAASGEAQCTNDVSRAVQCDPLPSISADVTPEVLPGQESGVDRPSVPRQSVAPGSSCSSPWCEWDALLEDETAKFWAMWGQAYRISRNSGSCWDWRSGGASQFFEDTLEGRSCDRNWLEGSLGGRDDRPFQNPSQALFGFDENIIELCSALLGVDPLEGSQDLNVKLADKCRRAKRNVLRLMTGSWNMCQNFEWQMCALQGKLPCQGGRAIAFATRPRDLQLEWWQHPSLHPTYPCQPNGQCDPGAFTVGDVFFAEVVVAYQVCNNGGRLLELDVDEAFHCQLDRDKYWGLVHRLQGSH